tara:strand:- start:1254 stop:1502 length:249 start_codon:yes stop_codon:yes gene_type:complete
MNTNKKLLSENEVEKIYGLNARTLQRERTVGSGIPYHKIGRRVKYHVEDIEKYLEHCKVGNKVTLFQHLKKIWLKTGKNYDL